jgi:hypothetical protein
MHRLVILRAVDLGTRVPELLLRNPLVSRVRLVGSRAGGEPTLLADWDFVVETKDLQPNCSGWPRSSGRSRTAGIRRGDPPVDEA